MIRFVIPFTLCFTWNIAAMAVEGTKNVETPLRPPTTNEQFDSSPRGQELQNIFDKMMKGDPSAEGAYQEYRQKYNIAAPAERARQRMQERLQGQAPPQQNYNPLVLPPGASQ